MLKSAWTEKDQIDNFLKEGRLMRSLEKFVCGRPYEGDILAAKKDHMIYHMMSLSLQVVRHRYSNPMIQPEPEGSTQGYPLVSVEVLRSIKVKEFQRSFRHSDTERLSRSDEVLKNFKKDATLKLFKSTNQERNEHVGPEVTRSHGGKIFKMAKRDYAWLMISRCSRSL
ncbi:hypothetical protein Tco_1422800, partial [Tanacetum coccineum]